jgi:hypothetical protein
MVRVIRSLSFYAVAIAALAFLYTTPYLLAGILLGLTIVTLFVDRGPNDIYFPVFGFVFGPMAEILSVSQGGWTYTHPDIFGIPIWLPFGWGLAVLLVKRLAEAVAALRS